MLIAMFFALFGLIVLDKLHRMDIGTKITANRYRFYSLRDKLREAGIRGEINPEHWLFKYLDTTISKTITILDRVTIWRLLAVHLVYGKDQEVTRSLERLKEELNKNANRAFKEIHDEYMYLILAYIVHRHPFCKTFAALWLRPSKESRRAEAGMIANNSGVFVVRLAERQELIRTIEYQGVIPETSTFREFAPRAMCEQE